MTRFSFPKEKPVEQKEKDFAREFERGEANGGCDGPA